MSFLLFLGSNNPITDIECKEGISRLWVESPRESDEPVRQQFTKPHIAFIGAWDTRSKGFEYGCVPIIDEEDREEERIGRESVAALTQFLLDRLANEPEVELFTCVEGAEDAPVDEEHYVTTDYFGGKRFTFREGMLIHMYLPDAN
jgi:hypothetical protein